MHRSKDRSTLAGLQLDLRKDREEGVKLATDAMVKNLKTEMAVFQERIKAQPETVRIVKRPGYTGAGAGGWMDLAWIGMVLVVGWAVSAARRTQRESLRVAPVRRSTRS
jgi:rhombotail lipoprotein